MPDGSVINAFLILGSMVAGLGIISILIKKYSKKIKQNTNKIDLQVISKIGLRPKTNLYVIKAASKVLLIGVTDHNITTLSELGTEQKPQESTQMKNQMIKAGNPTQVTKQPALPGRKTPLPVESLSFGNFLKTAFKKN